MLGDLLASHVRDSLAPRRKRQDSGSEEAVADTRVPARTALRSIRPGPH
jgi:hypothetical protein